MSGAVIALLVLLVVVVTIRGVLRSFLVLVVGVALIVGGPELLDAVIGGVQ